MLLRLLFAQRGLLRCRLEVVEDWVRPVEQVDHFVVVLSVQEMDQEAHHHFLLAFELNFVNSLFCNFDALHNLEALGLLQIISRLRVLLLYELVCERVDLAGENCRPSVQCLLPPDLRVLRGHQGVVHVRALWVQFARAVLFIVVQVNIGRITRGATLRFDALSVAADVVVLFLDLVFVVTRFFVVCGLV